MKFFKAELQTVQKLCISEFQNSFGLLDFLIRENLIMYSIGNFV